MKTIDYIVRKEKGGKYYVTHKDCTYPILGSHGSNKEAIKFAATLEKMTVKEYMKARKLSDGDR